MNFPNPFDLEPMPEPPKVDGEPVVNNSPNAGNNSAAEQGLEIPSGWKPTAAEPVPVVRCRATSTTSGERCKRWSIRGTTVCQTHGGRLPNVVEHSQAVVESARLRLMGMTEQAIDVLEELLQPGTGEAIRMKAVENVLNRAGIKEATEFKVEVTNTGSPSDDVFKKLQIMRDRSEAQKREEEEAEAARLAEEENIIDVEEEFIEVIDFANEPTVSPENS